MPLYSKSILAPKKPSDGKRISIMSRHTLNDGKTPDERITPESFDEHDTTLAPKGNLVGAYYRNDIDFPTYEKQYREYLETIQDYLLNTLISPAKNKNITVLCIEETPEYCHRKILVEYAQELANKLGIPIETHIQ